MQYMVTGSDGKEYGPVGIEELKRWVISGNVMPTSPVKDFLSGRNMTAQEVPGLYATPPPAFPPQQNAQYYRPQAAPVSANHDVGSFVAVVFFAALGVALFFVLHGIGLIVCGSNLFRAIQLKQNGSRFGTVAIIVAAVGLISVGIGWMLRMGGARV